MGIKKKYNYIIEKRYIISLVLIILSSIVGIFVNKGNYKIAECITNTGLYLSPWWNLKFYALLLSCYEIFYLITNNNKGLSVAGSIIITFSSAVVYNFTKIDALIFGNAVVVLIDKLLNAENKKIKIVETIGIILSGIAYSYTFIPYAVSLGYLYLAIIVYVLIKNKKELKKNKFYLICSGLLSILGMILSKFIIPNNYSENVENVTAGINLLYSYLYSILLPFKNIENKELLASIISIWPVPMMISLYYIYKNEKHLEFLLPLTIMMVLGTVLCSIEIPNTLKTILLLNGVGYSRMMFAVQLANIFVLFYFISNIKEKLFGIRAAMRVSIIFVIILAFVAFPSAIYNRWYITLYAMEEVALVFLFLNMDESAYRKVLITLLVILTLISGVPVNFII